MGVSPLDHALYPSPSYNPPRPPGSSTKTRPRHQIKRSLSELASPAKRSGHSARHSTHHYHGHHGYRREKNRDLEGASEPQTAHPISGRYGRISLDMPRPEGMHTRRDSAMAVALVPRENVETRDVSGNSGRGKEEKLKRELDKAEVRVQGLKQSLVELHTFSTSATRRLAETYYAVLEKTSALQNTVTALKDLAEASKEIYQTFQKDSEELERDIQGQVNGLGSFEEQESKIDSLQGRIHQGRTRIQALSGRVDAVRNRVEAWERADQEWQERTRRRLKIIWTAMLTLTLIIVLLFVGFKYADQESPVAALEELAEALPKTIRQGAFNISRGVESLVEDRGQGLDESLLRSVQRGADDRLRGFDEL